MTTQGGSAMGVLDGRYKLPLYGYRIDKRPMINTVGKNDESTL